jgi:alkylation response protein AidB-like acyl-CoA dehydrogenase
LSICSSIKYWVISLKGLIMTMGSATIATDQSALVTARALAGQLDARAREGERLRTMPSDLVDHLRDAGMFGLASPRSLGGAELPAAEIVRVVEELCRADGSAGWTVLIGNSTAFLAWLDPAVAASLLADRPAPISAAVFAPTGQLTRAGDGLRLTGRWSYSSGSAHADLFFGGGLVMAAAGPRMVAGRGPDWRLAVTSASDVTVHDTWDSIGLRGTGSHDVTVDGLAVPVEHTMSPFFEAARHDGPLFRLPFFTLIGVTIAGFSLGVARRALDEMAAVANTKIRPPGPHPIGHDGDVQVAIAHAEGALQAARAFVFEALDVVWDAALSGDVPSDDRRARFLLANQHAMHVAVDAVTTAIGFGGMAALRPEHPLQRCLRDIHAANQHIYFSQAATKRYAKSLLGMEQETHWF